MRRMHIFSMKIIFSMETRMVDGITERCCDNPSKDKITKRISNNSRNTNQRVERHNYQHDQQP